MDKTMGKPTELAMRVNERLKAMRGNKAELAIKSGCSRSMVSQYLAGKYQSDATTVETALKRFLEETEGEYGTGQSEASTDQKEEARIKMPEKVECFESYDYSRVLSVCQSCQDNAALGIVVGRSGYGKTYALRKFSAMWKVAYVECNEAMNSKDLVRKIEQAIGLPKTYGSIDERLEHIIEFFKANAGYLLLVDEADKLITKYTQKKLEILRYIADGSHVGIVIAGEPALESAIRIYDTRFANRMDFYYKLRGLTRKEVEQYFSGYEMDSRVLAEMVSRATNSQNGCFRLFDRTLNNVLRILKETNETQLTMKVIQQASDMMMM